MNRVLDPVPALLLLLIRGILLWLLIPIAVLMWIVLHSWGQNSSLGACVGSYDINMCAALQRSLLRPLIPDPTVDYVPLSKMTEVTHRITFLDPY